MTVIAYKDGILAADKQTNIHKGIATKIRRIEDGTLVGASGEASWCDLLFVYCAGNKHILDKVERDIVVGLIIKPDGTKYRLQHPFLNMQEILLPCYAIGIGEDYAMGAMLAGASAIEAVEIASRLSPSCGGGVDVLRLAP